jgi:F420-dependent oxidoreductase-like protein
MSATMQFGVFVPQGWKLDLTEIDDPIEQYEAMTAVAKAADAEPNITSVWVYDHMHTVPTVEIETTFECWTITATMARDTERVRLGQMVGCNGYRNPALYAKIASTVDVASHGRLDAGIGAGWYEHEWRAYGYEWDETPVRMGKFREAVQVINKLWTEERASFAGKYYHVDGAINEPKGPQRPHPPLWIGGGGEQVTLKLVAQYAQACNVGGGNADVIRHKLEILKGHCDAVGRNYDEIIKSTSIEPLVPVGREADIDRVTKPLRGDLSVEEYRKKAWVGTPEQLAERISGLKEAGATYVLAYLPRVAYDHEPLHRFAQDVIPLVR